MLGEEGLGRHHPEAPCVLCCQTSFLEVNSVLISGSASHRSALLCEGGQDNLLISESITLSQPFLPEEN